MLRAEAVYRALLNCYPAAFRQEYGDQMALIFAEQLGEARQSGGVVRAGRLWLQAMLDALIVGPKEHCHVLIQDLRYAFRTLSARPGFTAVAILSLALGIGANTAIFSLWKDVLHSSLPGVDRPQELVMLSNPNAQGMWSGQWDGRTDGDRAWLSYEEFEQLRDHAGSFRAMMASQSFLDTWHVRVDGGDEEEATGRLVSGEFFQFLGARPAIGRLFTAAEDRGGPAYAVISYNYWQRRMGGRWDVLGKTLQVRRAVLTIIGVAPRGFVGETIGQQPDFWAPLRVQPLVMPGEDWIHDTPPNKAMWLHVFGRLRAGVTPAHAQAEANGIFRAGLESFYGALATGERRREFLDQRLGIWPGGGGASATRREFATSLTALFAGVGVLLLITCSNLANLLLARGAVRKPEIALRLSLGASRGRLIRQLVTESMALAVMGGAAGLLAAYFIHGLLLGMLSQSDPRFQMNFTLEGIVLGFAVAATAAAALLFGVLPAMQVTKEDAGASLKEQSRGAIGSRGQVRWARFLVSLQLALSLPLVVGAGLLARSLYNLQRVDVGFQAAHLVLVRADEREAGYDGPRADPLHRALLGEFLRIPGVRAASFSHLGLFSGGNSVVGVEVEGYDATSDHDRNSAVDVVGPGYFSVLGIPILAGREILESDHAAAPKVCVINEAFAKQFFAGRSPIGMRVTSLNNEKRTAYQVVGVAKNARTQNVRERVEPRFYVPATQSPLKVTYTFLLRTNTADAPVIQAARGAVQRVDRALPILVARSVEQQRRPMMAQDRVIAQLAIVFGSVALALACIGLYGVLSYGVARRTGEIAVRIALGAGRGRVIAMILRETGALILAGLALGAGLGYIATRLIVSRLYGVAPQDPLTLGLSIAILLSVAFSAAYLPARRASRLDPMSALRRE